MRLLKEKIYRRSRRGTPMNEWNNMFMNLERLRPDEENYFDFGFPSYLNYI